MATYTSNTFSVTVGGWQLAASNYVAAKMNTEIIHPRPDGETNSWERHRLTPDGQQFTIPVSVRGGSYPFQFALTTAPSGMTIGQTFGDANYGIITWANPTVGTHTVAVRVRTQEYSRNTSGLTDEDTVSFQLEVVDKEDTTKFIWLDPAGSDSNDGSFSSPRLTLDGVLNSTSYGGRQLHLKAGTYDTDGASQFDISSSQPAVIEGYGAATINWTQRNFAPGISGFYCGGVTGTEGGWGAAAGNPRYFTVGPLINRLTWYDFNMVNPVNGTSGADNPSSVMFTDLGGVTPREYITFSHCSETGRPAGAANSGALSILFSCRNVVCEESTVTGDSAQGFFYLKDSTALASVRRCNASMMRTASGCQSVIPIESENMEWCYNKLAHDDATNSNGMMVLRLDVTTTDCGTHWVYRNNVVNDVGGTNVVIGLMGANNANEGPFIVENNIVQSPNSPRISSGTRVTSTDNLEGTAYVDSNLDLVEPHRSTYLGTHGAEIA